MFYTIIIIIYLIYYNIFNRLNYYVKLNILFINKIYYPSINVKLMAALLPEDLDSLRREREKLIRQITKKWNKVFIVCFKIMITYFTNTAKRT